MKKQKVISIIQPNSDVLLNDLIEKGWMIKTVNDRLAILEIDQHLDAPELLAKDIVAPPSPFDEISDDEVLYWSTPYFDEIQARKQMQQQSRKEELDTREERHG